MSDREKLADEIAEWLFYETAMEESDSKELARALVKKFAALRAGPAEAGAQEPVAWHVKDSMGFVMVTRDESIADNSVTDRGGTKTPLYAAPQPQHGGMETKS